MLSLNDDFYLSTYLPLSLFCMSYSSDFPSDITFHKFFGKFRSASDIFFFCFHLKMSYFVSSLKYMGIGFQVASYFFQHIEDLIP